MAHSLNMAVRQAVPASLVLERASPIALAKALKNEKELQVRVSTKCWVGVCLPPDRVCPIFGKGGERGSEGGGEGRRGEGTGGGRGRSVFFL